MSIAATILNQLGGNRFAAMTGAKNFVSADRSLTFKIGRNASKANMVRITLDASDTYTVEFLLYANFDIKPVKNVGGIYADQLRAIFTATTGMATSL